MELRLNGKQQQQGEEEELKERREGPFQHPEHHPSLELFSNDLDSMTTLQMRVGQEVYQSKEVNGVQEHHWDAQQQLTRQERRQLELANSSRATIRQPPIRLSFPMDLEESLHSSNGINDQTDQPNVTSALSLTRDILGGSNDNRLARELRRISLEASRGSEGLSRRLSDVANLSKSGRGNGSGSGRSSLEGGKVDIDGYYPFTRSHVPTSVSSHQ